MNPNTIKEVLIKILSINKGLNEETLNKLLVASGWEAGDIQEGLRIFKDLSGKPAAVVEAPKLQPIAPPIEMTVSAPVMAAPDTPTPIKPPEPVAQPAQSPIQIASTMPASAPIQSNPPAGLNSIKEKLAAIHSVDTRTPDSEKSIASISSQQPISLHTPQAPPKDIHTPDPEEKGSTPWGFVLFDIFLFLIALGLLLFIFLK